MKRPPPAANHDNWATISFMRHWSGLIADGALILQDDFSNLISTPSIVTACRINMVLW